MALSKTRLSDRIYNALILGFGGYMDTIPEEGSEAGNETLRPRNNLRIIADAVAEGVVDEITQYAVVQTTSGAPDGEHTGRIY
jgi:hypothetical protein